MFRKQLPKRTAMLAESRLWRKGFIPDTEAIVVRGDSRRD